MPMEPAALNTTGGVTGKEAPSLDFRKDPTRPGGGVYVAQGARASDFKDLPAGTVINELVGAAATPSPATSIYAQQDLLLPDPFLFTLDVARADKRGIRSASTYDLWLTCEDGIVLCTDPVCDPLRCWVGRTYEFNAVWATPNAAKASNAALRAACERDLQNTSVRLKVYLEDDQTARALRDCVQTQVLA
ncbi:hypothetical protein FB107DRAFT_278808 [Schizophyllum commune]